MKRMLPGLVLIAAAVLFGYVMLTGGVAPKGAFDINGAELAELMKGDKVGAAMTEIPWREIEGAPLPCQTARTVRFGINGTMTVEQICRSQEGHIFTSESAGSWRIENDQLCLDTGHLDYSPSCWHVAYKDGLWTLADKQFNVKWQFTLSSSRFSSVADMLAAIGR